MGKYEPLGSFLTETNADQIPMTFDEVEKIIGSPLPDSKRYPAWWSNNDTNNVMTKIWIAAGYRTEQVDIEGQKLVFRKIGGATAPVARSTTGRHPLIGCLKGLITVAPGTDLTEPADPDWADMLDNDDEGRKGRRE